MSDAIENASIIEELYNRYRANGFISENEALECFEAHGIQLLHIDSLIEKLLSIGVIIKSVDSYDASDGDDHDRTRTNYSRIYKEAIRASPNLRYTVTYLLTIKPPQHREWQVLIPQAQSGNKYARDRIFRMYLRVVLKIALTYYRDSAYELEDIFQVGTMGLLRAIEAYNFSKNGSFVSYFFLWVSQYIQRDIDDLSRTIRLPAHLHANIRRVKKAVALLKAHSIERPTIAEIAITCEMSKELVQKVIFYDRGIASIEDLFDDDKSGRALEEAEYDEEQSIESEAERHDLQRIVGEILGTLSEKESRILCLRYGIYGNDMKTLEEVGEIMGVTRERIRQIEYKAITKLNRSANFEKIDGYFVK